jgi:hypothetical protein
MTVEHNEDMPVDHEITDEMNEMYQQLTQASRAAMVFVGFMPILGQQICSTCKMSIIQFICEEIVGSAILLARCKGFDINPDEFLDDMKEGVQEFVAQMDTQVKLLKAEAEGMKH